MSVGTAYAKVIAECVGKAVLAYDGNVFWDARGLRYGKERAFSPPQYVRVRGGDGDER